MVRGSWIVAGESARAWIVIVDRSRRGNGNTRSARSKEKQTTYLSFSSSSDPAELIEELLPRNNIPYYVVGMCFRRGRNRSGCMRNVTRISDVVM